MLATYGGKLLQVTTICVLLPYTIRCLSQNHTYIPLSEKRSLNNYIATSVPYTVENQSSHSDELTTHEKVDTALTNSDGNSQDVLDCLNENHCVNNNTSNEPSSSEGTFRPYSQDELNKILQKYHGEKETIEAQETSNKVANYYSIASSNNIESSSPSSTDSHDKSKAWNVVNYSQNYNKNPYDDRMGWVTLEPIAWSSSQVQKWEPNQKPMWPLPPQNNGPWGSSPQFEQQPAYSSYSERPYKKPTYQYQNNRPWSANQHYQKPSFGGGGGGSFSANQEIITDGQPGYFPADRPSSTGGYKPWVEQTQSISYIDSSNRPATHVVYQGIGTGSAHPHHISERPAPASSSSAEGDGHWVLLSSTKGYSVPHRQRSFGRALEPDDKVNNVDAKEEKPQKSYRPFSARRSIKLTVLPSANGKTVTSHNGLIEVEAGDQSVDEARREHFARMMRFNNTDETSLHSSSPTGIPGKVEAVAKPATRRNAVLSAVGAGMIPATMAMLLPMLLGRRKRSVHEPHIITLNLRKYNKRGIVTTEDQNKPIKEISKKRILSEVQFY